MIFATRSFTFLLKRSSDESHFLLFFSFDSSVCVAMYKMNYLVHFQTNRS